MARVEPPDAAPEPESTTPSGWEGSSAASTGLSLAEVPIAGLTRRRVALLLGAVVAAWVVLLFAHQVGQASEASARADAMRVSNAALQANVAGLQAELALIQRQAFIEQQARAYRLGTPREIPFTLADNAPPLPTDAPGSAGVRLGATTEQPSPIEQWIHLLFGPGGAPSSASSSGG